VAPPYFTVWSDVEAAINAVAGAAILMVDMTGLPGFAHVPSTANLDGHGRLQIIGVGPNGEAELVMDDGAQIKNIQSMYTIVFRAQPTIRVPLVWDLVGVIVNCYDATFLFDGPAATLPVMQINAPYIGMFFSHSSELRNSHNPGAAVLDITAGSLLLLSIDTLFFPSSFDSTISGPVGSSLQLETDASQTSTPSIPAFLGVFTTARIDNAANIDYVPANLVNWSGVAPTSVANALDRIAAKIGPIP
jgi:hypothetical protein